MKFNLFHNNRNAVKSTLKFHLSLMGLAKHEKLGKSQGCKDFTEMKVD
jgi:hypothetical protein